MYRKIIILFILCVIIIGYMAFKSSQKSALASDSFPTKWEYKVLVFADMGTGTALKMTEELNKYGNDGWELAAQVIDIDTEIDRIGDTTYPRTKGNSFYIIMKKPK